MMDKKCCENHDKNGCCHSGHGMMMMDCCQEHKMSKEHLEMKKKMLEEKLKWVNEELGKK
jgi:hypothetical protein